MLNSTIGKKIVVAVTGLIMFGFVIGHLLGNLQIFQGSEQVNNYAAFLKHATPLLWGTRIVLLIAIGFHIVFTIQLNRLNRASRPIVYHRPKIIQATVSSRFMLWSGIFLLAYIIFHLVHLTFGAALKPFSSTDVYANMVNGFKLWPVSVGYIVGMIALGFHLNHGIFSVFQTLGLNNPKYNSLRKQLAVGASTLIVLGYISIPVAVLFGWVS